MEEDRFVACDRGWVPSGSQAGLSTVAGVQAPPPHPSTLALGLSPEPGKRRGLEATVTARRGNTVSTARVSAPVWRGWWRCSWWRGLQAFSWRVSLPWGGRDPSCHRGICAVPPAASGPCDASAPRTPTHARLALSVQGVLVLPTRSLHIRSVRFCCRFRCSRPWGSPLLRPSGFCPHGCGRPQWHCFKFWACPCTCRERPPQPGPRCGMQLYGEGRAASAFRAPLL